MSMNELKLKMLEERTGIVVGQRHEITCNECGETFWHTWRSTCSSCEDSNNKTYRKETELGKIVSHYIGMFFFPITIFLISSYVGFVMHSIIREILPVIPLGFGFILGVWILVSQKSYTHDR